MVRGLANGHFISESDELWFWGPVMPCGDMHKSIIDTLVFLWIMVLLSLLAWTQPRFHLCHYRIPIQSHILPFLSTSEQNGREKPPQNDLFCVECGTLNLNSIYQSYLASQIQSSLCGSNDIGSARNHLWHLPILTRALNISETVVPTVM